MILEVGSGRPRKCVSNTHPSIVYSQKKRRRKDEEGRGSRNPHPRPGRLYGPRPVRLCGGEREGVPVTRIQGLGMEGRSCYYG